MLSKYKQHKLYGSCDLVEIERFCKMFWHLPICKKWTKIGNLSGLFHDKCKRCFFCDNLIVYVLVLLLLQMQFKTFKSYILLLLKKDTIIKYTVFKKQANDQIREFCHVIKLTGCLYLQEDNKRLMYLFPDVSSNIYSIDWTLRPCR